MPDQPRARAAAAVGQRAGAIDGHAFGVEQAVQQRLRRQRVVQQFRVGQRGGQYRGGAPAFLLRLGVQRRIDAAGAGDLFQDQRAGAPAGLGLFAGEMQHAAYLLAGAEIVQCHFGEVAALDGDDALMAVLLRPLVHGEGQVAAAEQSLAAGGWRVLAQQRGQLRRTWRGHSRAARRCRCSRRAASAPAPSPFACRLNEPRNFSAPDSAAASARDWPASRVTTGWLSCRVSSASASGPSRTSRPRTGRCGR